MRRTLTVVALVAAPCVAVAQTGPLSRANWLAGCWELRAPNRVTLEMWMPALGDMMLGSSRTTVGATTSEFEQLRLKVDGDKLVYTALPSGQRETSFPSDHPFGHDARVREHRARLPTAHHLSSPQRGLDPGAGRGART